MKGPMILRALALLAVLALAGWVVHKTRWEQVEVEDEARGVAATDTRYSLRRILHGAGATLEIRTSLEPLPPADATLLLESRLWNIFPERDARLQAWVERGGHLVLLSPRVRGDADDLRWVPLSSWEQRRKAVGRAPGGTRAPLPAASHAEGENDDAAADNTHRGCVDFREIPPTTRPAFQPGRVYGGCMLAGVVRPLNHAVPTWVLASPQGTLAMRVPVGRGDVTGVSPFLVLDNRELLREDNALIAAAVLQAAPGRAVWIVEDEAREPFVAWLWHEARTPLLLALAAIALSLWRLLVRFGPREAVPPRARRSMGEQVRGTGRFIAGTDAGALHAATRRAFEDAARTRVQAWAERDDGDRTAALAQALGPAHAVDAAALLASLHVGGGATNAQILAATAVLEQARRAILRASAARSPS